MAEEIEQVCLQTLIAINACLGPCIVELRSKDPERVATVMRLAMGQMYMSMRRVEHAMREGSTHGSRTMGLDDPAAAQDRD